MSLRWDLDMDQVIEQEGKPYRIRSWTLRKHRLRRRGRVYHRPSIGAREVPPGVYCDAPDGLILYGSCSGVGYRSLAAIDMAIEELSAMREKWVKLESEHLRKREKEAFS